MFNAHQARSAFASLLDLEDSTLGFTSTSHTEEVKVELRQGISASIQQMVISVKEDRIADDFIGGQVFEQFWRCTGFPADSKSEVLITNNYSATIDSARVDRLSSEDGWIMIKFAPVQN